MKRLLITGLAAAAALSMVGCMGISNYDIETLGVDKQKAFDTRDAALEYLNEKYAEKGDTFIPNGFVPNSWETTDYKQKFESEKYNGKIVDVIIQGEKGNYTFKDNYYTIYLQDEIKPIVDEVIEASGIDAKYYVEMDKSWGGNPYTMEEYLELDAEKEISGIQITFLSDQGYDEAMVWTVLEELEARGMNKTVRFNTMESQEEIDSLVNAVETDGERIGFWEDDQYLYQAGKMYRYDAENYDYIEITK